MTKGQTMKCDAVEDVWNRPLYQEEEVTEAFYRQLEIALQPLALVLVGEISHSETCWRSNTVRDRAPRKFLENMYDNLLT